MRDTQEIIQLGQILSMSPLAARAGQDELEKSWADHKIFGDNQEARLSDQ